MICFSFAFSTIFLGKKVAKFEIQLGSARLSTILAKKTEQYFFIFVLIGRNCTTGFKGFFPGRFEQRCFLTQSFSMSKKSQLGSARFSTILAMKSEQYFYIFVLIGRYRF